MRQWQGLSWLTVMFKGVFFFMKSILFGMHQRREIRDELSDCKFPKNYSASCVLLGDRVTCYLFVLRSYRINVAGRT